MDYLQNLVLVGLTVSAVSHLLHSWRTLSNIPKSLQWAGCRHEVFSRARACARELFAGLQSLRSGYNQHSKRGQSFVVPDAAFRPQVMVPREYVTWLTGQPDDVLATRAPQAERFAMPYLVPTLDVKHERFTMDVVRKDPTRNLGRLQPDFFIDMRESVDSLLGLEEESWREIRLYEIMQKIIFKSTNRVLVGLPLCHNEDFLSSSAAFSQWLGVGAVIVGQLMPSILKPFFGYLMAIPIYLAQTRSFRYLVPVIRERMENIRRKRANPSFVFDKPNDMITWMVEAALNDQNTRNNRPEATAERILFLMLGAIPTAANTFLDLLSSPPELGYYKSLQEEAAAIFRTEQDWADSTLLGKFSYADSAIRESLRKNPVLTRVVLREVVRKEGLDMPDGHHLPRGTWIGVPAVGIHHDERFYHEPEIHDPFRFTRVSSKEAMSSHYTPGEFSSAGVAIKESKYRKPQGLSTTSDTYLAFGYGRHACPGRWFVAHQLKLLLAYIVLNYDIQPLDKRPLNRVFGDSIIPSQTATIKVRRRKRSSNTGVVHGVPNL